MALVEDSPCAFCQLRILVADDDSSIQKVVALHLQSRGHSVELVSNGRAAVERLQAQDYDLVLTDLEMPVMDGFAAAAAIRSLSQRSKASVPIVAMSGQAVEGMRERCREAGIDEFVPKPFDWQELVGTVERVAGEKDRS